MISFFIKKYDIKSNLWQVLRTKIDFNCEEFRRAQEQAVNKSRHTMIYSQSGSERNEVVKYNMQLMGIIAEMACKEYLELVLKKRNLSNNWEVNRYDDVRTDNFMSAENEYDLKIQTLNEPHIEYSVESRSSITYNRSLIEGLIAYDIIGPYISDVKVGEAPNSIYLRPLYSYSNFKKGDYKKENFETLLVNGSIILFLVAGCTHDNLLNNGIIKSMGQGNTRYNVLPIIESTDIISFQNTIEEILLNL